MKPVRPDPTRAAIRHRRPVKQPNRYVGPIIIIGVIALILQMYWMQQNWSELSRRGEYAPFDEAMIEKLKAKVINLYECEYCSGSGLLEDPDQPGERILCPICWGVGYHATRRYSDEGHMCLACGGMGRHYDEAGHAVVCARCEGRGIVEFED